jgi:hypothetical protein
MRFWRMVTGLLAYFAILRGDSRKVPQSGDKGVTSGLHIANRRLFDFAAGRLQLWPLEQEHLHGCEICGSVLNIFLLNQPISAAHERTEKPEDAA